MFESETVLMFLSSGIAFLFLWLCISIARNSKDPHRTKNDPGLGLAIVFGVTALVIVFIGAMQLSNSEAGSAASAIRLNQHQIYEVLATAEDTTKAKEGKVIYLTILRSHDGDIRTYILAEKPKSRFIKVIDNKGCIFEPFDISANAPPSKSIEAISAPTKTNPLQKP